MWPRTHSHSLCLKTLATCGQAHLSMWSEPLDLPSVHLWFDLFLLYLNCQCPTEYQSTPSIWAPSVHLSVTTSPVWRCSVRLKDKRLIRHLLRQVGKQTVQRKSGDEGRDLARGHSPYGGPVLRPGMCLYRPQAQLIKPTSDPMWWPLGRTMT